MDHQGEEPRRSSDEGLRYSASRVTGVVLIPTIHAKSDDLPAGLRCFCFGSMADVNAR